jgi:hypothetical protein
METMFGKAFGALQFAVAMVRIAFSVPLYTDNGFENRVESFRRARA